MASIREAELKAGLTALKDIKQALLQRGGARARSGISRHRGALLRAENMRHGLVGLRKSAEHLAGLASPLVTQTVVINAPFLIWAYRDLVTASPILKASQIEPWNSWAKVLATVDTDTFVLRDDVSFFYLWQNDTGSDAVVNVSTYLIAYGFWELVVDNWPILGGASSASLYLDAHLWPYEWWNQPPTLPIYESSLDEQVLYVSLTGSGVPFTQDPSANSGYVSYPANLAYTNFSIPQDGVAVFEVDLQMVYSTFLGGYVDADFDFRDYQIICPYLRVDILTPLAANVPPVERSRVSASPGAPAGGSVRSRRSR
jgi:hypothetical protein